MRLRRPRAIGTAAVLRGTMGAGLAMPAFARFARFAFGHWRHLSRSGAIRCLRRRSGDLRNADFAARLFRTARRPACTFGAARAPNIDEFGSRCSNR